MQTHVLSPYADAPIAFACEVAYKKERLRASGVYLSSGRTWSWRKYVVGNMTHWKFCASANPHHMAVWRFRHVTGTEPLTAVKKRRQGRAAIGYERSQRWARLILMWAGLD